MRQAVNSVVEGFKGSPGFLALVMLNLIVFGLIYAASERRDAEMTRILDTCLDREKS